MATIESLEVKTMLDSSGFIQGAMQSQAALNNLARSAGKAGQATEDASLGFDDIITSAKGLAVALAGAFTAKRALDDFSKSTLPGAAAFNQSMGMMRVSLLRLSESVGEFLAPGAILFSKLLTGIANKLEPLIRIVSAFKESATGFLMGMAQNALGAFRSLMPSVAGIFDGIMSWWNQNVDWAAKFEEIKAVWNKVWTEIGQFAAPIIVRLAALADTLVSTIRDGLSYAVQKARDAFGGLGQGFDIQGIVDAVKATAVVLIGAAEFAIQNWRMVFEIMMTAGGIAVEFLKNNFMELGSYVVEVFTVASNNILTTFSQLGKQLQPTFEAIAHNFSEALTSAFNAAVQKFNGKGETLDANLLTPEEIAKQFPGDSVMSGWYRDIVTHGAQVLRAVQKTPDFLANDGSTKPNFRDIPFPQLSGLTGLQAMPSAAFTSSAKQQEMTEALGKLVSSLNSGVITSIADTQAKAQEFLDKLLKNLPGVTGTPTQRSQRVEPLNALLFGTAAAFARESNQASKNPVVGAIKEQTALTAEQLVIQRAQQRAQQRKAPVINF